MSKSDWIDGIRHALPNAFCRESHYYRKCFSVTAEECKAAVNSAADVCLTKNNHDIPGTLIRPRDSALLGAIINVCTSRGYESSFTNKRIHNKKCDDPNNWQ